MIGGSQSVRFEASHADLHGSFSYIARQFCAILVRPDLAGALAFKCFRTRLAARSARR
jgi:hypothetical protein